MSREMYEKKIHIFRNECWGFCFVGFCFFCFFVFLLFVRFGLVWFALFGWLIFVLFVWGFVVLVVVLMMLEILPSYLAIFSALSELQAWSCDADPAPVYGTADG